MFLLFMHFTIHHDNLKLKSTFSNYIESVLSEKFHQYFKKLSDQKVAVNVSFHKGSNKDIECKIVMRTGDNHLIIRGDSCEKNISSAFEVAVVKISHKMSKYKDRFEEYVHHYGKHKDSIKDTVKRTREMDYGYDSDGYEDSVDDVPSTMNSSVPVEVLSQEQAVMKMDIGGLGALCYKDLSTGAISFVYRRADGMVSFIEGAEAFA